MNSSFNNTEVCPKCGDRLRSWSELTDDERFIAVRLPGSADHDPRSRKKHRFCTRCWFEDVGQQGRTA